MTQVYCSICKELFDVDDSVSCYSVGEYVDMAHEDCLKQFLLKNKDNITIKATYFNKPKKSGE